MLCSLRLSTLLAVSLLLLVILPSPSDAFGAGNIASVSKVEGQRFRHGDIEDILSTIRMAKVAGGHKFRGLDIKRVYFGNWLRDYSQAVDVGTVKHVPVEAIRILLWILAFLTFGFGTREFEVTKERLGCYRPEEHIDNPKDYADNVDARQFDSRLRGPVNESVELAVDPRTGLKTYISSEDKGITTSASMIRDLFGRCIYLGRQYGRTKDKADLYEALRLLGTGCHCLEDFSAHSNYVELALRNCGEGDIFPLVGRQALHHVDGAAHPKIFPIVTGTFGGVDFLHSVVGEFSDRVTQSEIEELEGTMTSAQQQENPSILKDLLSKLPTRLLGGGNEATKMDELQANNAAYQMRSLSISPQNQDLTQQLVELKDRIYPILEFHDNIMMKITSFIEHIPILPGLVEKLQEQINIFVFSLLAPLMLPLISQIKQELTFGSSEVIQSSKKAQLNIFHDDHCTDPTHSMLSKDHFSNVLNEPAGKVATGVLQWAVPQLMAAWDDESIDVNRTLNRIIHGVFHHPALRERGDDGARDCRAIMFTTVQSWWKGKSEAERKVLRKQLSYEGVMNGANHKEGVQDTGHGNGKLGAGRPHAGGKPNVLQPGATASSTGGASPLASPSSQAMATNYLQSMATGALGGTAVGGIVGGLVGTLGSNYAAQGPAPQQSGQSYNYQSQSNQPAYQTHDYNTPGQHPHAQTHEPSYAGEGSQQYYPPYQADSTSAGYGAQPSYSQAPYDAQDQQHSLQDGKPHKKQNHPHKPKRQDDSNSDDSEDSGDSVDDPAKKERKRLRKEQRRREKQERKRQEHQAMLAGQGGGQQRPQQPSNNLSYGASGNYPDPAIPPHHSAYGKLPPANPLETSGFYGNNLPPPGPPTYPPSGSPTYPSYDNPYSNQYQGYAPPPPQPPHPLATAAAASAWDVQQQGAYQSPPSGYGTGGYNSPGYAQPPPPPPEGYYGQQPYGGGYSSQGYGPGSPGGTHYGDGAGYPGQGYGLQDQGGAGQAGHGWFDRARD